MVSFLSARERSQSFSDGSPQSNVANRSAGDESARRAKGAQSENTLGSLEEVREAGHRLRWPVEDLVERIPRLLRQVEFALETDHFFGLANEHAHGEVGD